MTLKDLRARLLSRLSEFLVPLGYHRREQTFVRDATGCQFFFHLSFIHHRGVDSDITADVAVRHHAVEDLLNARQSDFSKREASRTATIGAALGNLAGVGQHRWTLGAAEDVEPIVAGIFERFQRIGRPFLERFSSPAETLRVLESDDPFARLICPIPNHREETRNVLPELLARAD